MKKVILVLLLVVLCMALFADENRVSIDMLIGSGTEGSPYLVEDYADLVILSTNSSYWGPGKFIKQTADIDASASSTLNSGQGLSTIGNDSSSPFFAYYDGDGHTISNLFIDRADDKQGLFGFCMVGAILNLGLIDSNISGSSQVGSLVGHATNDFYIDNCYVIGDVNGATQTGGLVGEAYSSYISNSSADVNVTSSESSSNTGGLVGLLRNNSNINNCSSQGSVTGYNSVGGLVGNMFSIVTVSNSYSECDVTGNTSVGGAVGNATEATSITASFATGTVQATGQNSGGFFGSISGSSSSNLILHNCYSSGNASGEAFIGGFGGYTSETDVNYCYSTGTPTVTTSGAPISGFVANSYNSQYANSFWDVTASGMETSSEGVGKTTTEMQTLTTFTNAGWDFVDEIPNGEEDLWKLDASRNSGYPYLTWAEDLFPSAPSDPVCPHVTGMLPENGSNNVQPDEIYNWDAIPEVAGYTRGYEITINNETFPAQAGTSFVKPAGLEFSTEYTWSVKPYYMADGSAEKIYPDTAPEDYNFYTMAGVIPETPNEENPINLTIIVVPEGATPFVPVILTTLPTEGYAYQPLFALTYNFEVSGIYTIAIGATYIEGSIYHIFIGGRELEFGVEWDIDDGYFVMRYEYDSSKGDLEIVITNDDSTLPVTLSSFTALAQADQFVTLQWVTESESNLLGYNVYRAESENFSQAMRINPSVVTASNQSVTSTYTYTDNEIESTTYYYWLEVAELANENSFHGPIAVTVEDEVVVEGVTMTQFNNFGPSPFTDATSTNLRVKEGERASITIYNLLGQVVNRETFNLGNIALLLMVEI